MRDPTYVRAEIEANPTWHLAFVLSELENDNAPIGWSRYIPTAEHLRRCSDVTPKGSQPEGEPEPEEPTGEPVPFASGTG